MNQGNIFITYVTKYNYFSGNSRDQDREKSLKIGGNSREFPGTGIPLETLIEAVWKNLKKIYYGINLEDVIKTLKKCHICKRNKTTIIKKFITPIIEDSIRNRYQIDLIDMTDYIDENDKYKYIITILDCASKYGYVSPQKTKNAIDTLKEVKNFVFLFGPPNKIHTDNGKEFKNKDFNEFCQQYNIEHIFGRPYTPHHQGQIERFYRTLKTKIFKQMAFKKTSRWIDMLKETVYSYNIKTHRAHNSTPFLKFLNFSEHKLIYNINSNVDKNDNITEYYKNELLNSTIKI